MQFAVNWAVQLPFFNNSTSLFHHKLLLNPAFVRIIIRKRNRGIRHFFFLRSNTNFSCPIARQVFTCSTSSTISCIPTVIVQWHAEPGKPYKVHIYVYSYFFFFVFSAYVSVCNTKMQNMTLMCPTGTCFNLFLVWLIIKHNTSFFPAI